MSSIPVGKGRCLFSSGASLCPSAILQARPHAQEKSANRKQTPYFGGLFVSTLFFVLLVLVYFDFRFCVEREYTELVGREVRGSERN